MSHDTDKTSYPPVLCHACPNVRQERAQRSLRRFVQCGEPLNVLSVKSRLPTSCAKAESLIRISRYAEQLSWLQPDLQIWSSYVSCL